MEQMKKIIDKMQALQASNEQMSQIDIDLMLDYTRRLYEELLIKKGNLINDHLSVEEKVENEAEKSPSSNIVADDNKENSKSQTFEQEEKEQQIEQEVNSVDSKIQQEVEDEDKNPPTKPEGFQAEPELEESGETDNLDSAEKSKELSFEPSTIEEKEDTSNIVEEEILSEEGIKEIAEENINSEPAEEAKEITKTTNKNLVNFEMPPQKQTEWEKQDITVAPTSSQKEKTEGGSCSDKNTASPKEEMMKPLEFDFGQDLQFVPKNSKAFDVRSAIGVNDRYLFLNELFFKKKDAYDKALESINQLNNIEEAIDFTNGLAKELNWDKEEPTVQSFYQVLNKAFATK